MKTKIDYESETLKAVVLDLLCFGEDLRRGKSYTAPGYRNDPRQQTYASEVIRFGLRYAPGEWQKGLTAAEREGFSRGVKHLERLRLVVPVERYGKRLTHLQPTPRDSKSASSCFSGCDVSNLQAIDAALEVMAGQPRNTERRLRHFARRPGHEPRQSANAGHDRLAADIPRAYRTRKGRRAAMGRRSAAHPAKRQGRSCWTPGGYKTP